MKTQSHSNPGFFEQTPKKIQEQQQRQPLQLKLSVKRAFQTVHHKIAA